MNFICDDEPYNIYRKIIDNIGGNSKINAISIHMNKYVDIYFNVFIFKINKKVH